MKKLSKKSQHIIAALLIMVFAGIGTYYTFFTKAAISDVKIQLPDAGQNRSSTISERIYVRGGVPIVANIPMPPDGSSVSSMGLGILFVSQKTQYWENNQQNDRYLDFKAFDGSGAVPLNYNTIDYDIEKESGTIFRNAQLCFDIPASMFGRPNVTLGYLYISAEPESVLDGGGQAVANEYSIQSDYFGSDCTNGRGNNMFYRSTAYGYVGGANVGIDGNNNGQTGSTEGDSGAGNGSAAGVNVANAGGQSSQSANSATAASGSAANQISDENDIVASNSGQGSAPEDSPVDASAFFDGREYQKGTDGRVTATFMKARDNKILWILSISIVTTGLLATGFWFIKKRPKTPAN